MTVRESVPLASLTTFKIGGSARYVVECEKEEGIAEAVAFAKGKGLPWYPLGEGSNVLAADEGYEGVIVRLALDGVMFTEEGDSTTVIAEAGKSWDALVREAAERGLWGIENLAGIPGTAGAAPVQNIGAYGSELADTLIWVDAFDPENGETVRLNKEECLFGYRDSRFKRDPGLVIVRIALKLSASGKPKTTYKDLARLVEAGEALDTPAAVGDAVRRIRAKKFPDLAVYGTAGSFFKNPIIPASAFGELKKKHPELPGFPAEDGVKVPLAWILDHVLSLRSFRIGPVSLFEAQPLVIVADKGATAEDVASVAREVAARVNAATGIDPEWEVRKFPK